MEQKGSVGVQGEGAKEGWGQRAVQSGNSTIKSQGRLGCKGGLGCKGVVQVEVCGPCNGQGHPELHQVAESPFNLPLNVSWGWQRGGGSGASRTVLVLQPSIFEGKCDISSQNSVSPIVDIMLPPSSQRCVNSSYAESHEHRICDTLPAFPNCQRRILAPSFPPGKEGK